MALAVAVVSNVFGGIVALVAAALIRFTARWIPEDAPPRQRDLYQLGSWVALLVGVIWIIWAIV